MFGRIRAQRRKDQQMQQEMINKRREENAAYDPWKNLNAYEDKIRQEASKYRTSLDEARSNASKEADQLINNPPQGLNTQQREDLRNNRSQQISRDIQNYNRMLTGKQGVRGVRGGSTAAAQAELARLGQENLSDYERSLADMDSKLSMQKLAAKFAATQGGAAEELLSNQQAYDKILGYLQNENQKRLAERADEFFFKI